MTKTVKYVGIVEKVVSDGKHGPYAVARCNELDTITFSLDNSVWHEKRWPENGVYVMLFDIQQKRAGWRAMRGRFVRPSDSRTQQPSNQVTQKGAKR